MEPPDVLGAGTYPGADWLLMTGTGQGDTTSRTRHPSLHGCPATRNLLRGIPRHREPRVINRLAHLALEHCFR